ASIIANWPTPAAAPAIKSVRSAHLRITLRSLVALTPSKTARSVSSRAANKIVALTAKSLRQGVSPVPLHHHRCGRLRPWGPLNWGSTPWPREPPTNSRWKSLQSVLTPPPRRQFFVALHRPLHLARATHQ